LRTPLVADGVIYLTTPFCRAVALDAEAEREIWAFDSKLPYNPFANRGLALWRRGGEERVYFQALAIGRVHADVLYTKAVTSRP
jgi:quinoprotein glucose dehydrogenase